MPHAADPRADRLIGDLRAWTPLEPELSRLRDDYFTFVGVFSGAALQKGSGPEHVTASCFVFTADLTQVLLCFHGKGRFWVQLGGHIESADRSVAEAAYREAGEECGINDLAPLGIVDVDRHPLGGGFSCSTHWDVGFAAVARLEATPVVSAESDDVAWWPVDALPDNVPPQFGRRIARVLAELAHPTAARRGLSGV